MPPLQAGMVEMAVATIPAPAQAALLLFHRGEETRCHCSGGRQQQVPTPVALR